MQYQIELTIGLLAVVIAIGVLSRWLRVPYPVLLVVTGLLLGLPDGAPKFHLDPDLVFLVFMPPLLYAAAFNTDWQEFRAQIRAISLLAVGLVLFTTVLVAWVAHQVVGMPWPTGFVLGAIVAPPDAVAATAITRRLMVPRHITTIVEGESLVNDASALVAYRLALAAVMGSVVGPGKFALTFLTVSAGGIGIGVAGGWLAVRIHSWLNESRLGDPKLNIALTLLTPFALYLTAEHLHVSGVLAVVTAGIWVGSRVEQVFNPVQYIESRSVWEMIEFLLNGLIFVLIGFQLPDILDALSANYMLPELCQHATAIAAVVIAARLIWVFPSAYIPRWLDRKIYGHGEAYPPWQWVVVVGWTGMRGVVSLAAAMAIPHTLPDGTKFPSRDLILFLTFWVIFATLVVQGLTLPLVIRSLGMCRLPAGDPGEEGTRC